MLSTDTSAFNEITANRVVRRVNELRAYAKRTEEWAAAEIRRTQRQEARLMQWIGPQLETWARRRLGGGHRRSIALPGGTISLRRQPVRPAVVDEHEVMAWCRAHLTEAVQLDISVAGPAIITVRQWLEQIGLDADVNEKLRRKVITDHVKANGELLPGMDMGGGDERLYIG